MQSRSWSRVSNFFAGAQVGEEFHHRVLPVEVPREAGDEGFAGHLFGVIVDGGAAAQTSGRRVCPAPDPGAGDVDAVPGQLETFGVDLVDGGHPQGVAQALAVAHREPDGVRRPQHPVGGRDVAPLQGRTDAAGGNRLALILGHGQHMDFHPQGLTQLLEQGGVPRRPGPEGEIFPAEEGPGVAIGHQAPDKLVGGHGLDVLKGGGQVMLHPQLRHQAVLVLGGEEAAALYLAAHGQLEGKDRRGRAVGFGPFHGPADHRPVADVDTVKIAQRHRAALLAPQIQGGHGWINLHSRFDSQKS